MIGNRNNYKNLDPFQLNNQLLFTTSGKEYAGSVWLGSGQETKKLSIDKSIYGTRTIINNLVDLIYHFTKVVYQNSFLSSLVLFFSHKPD